MELAGTHSTQPSSTRKTLMGQANQKLSAPKKISKAELTFLKQKQANRKQTSLTVQKAPLVKLVNPSLATRHPGPRQGPSDFSLPESYNPIFYQTINVTDD